MVRTLATLTALLVSVLLVYIGHGMQQTLIPLRGDIAGFSPLKIGFLTASYNLGFAIGCLLIQFMIMRAGHIRTFAALISISSIAPLIHPLIITDWVWYSLRLLTGFSIAGISLVFESWLNERSTNENRGRVITAYALTYTLGIIIGQLLLSAGSPLEMSSFVIAAVFLSLAVVPLTMTRTAQPLPIALVRFRPGRLIKISPSAVFTAFIAGGCINTFFGMGPVAATNAGLSSSQAALFIGFGIGGGVLLQLPAGQLSDRIDRRYVLIGLALLSSISAMALVVAANNNPDWLYYVALIFGAAIMPMYAISIAHMFDLIDPDTYVESSSGMLLSSASGAIVIPAGVGLLGDIYGYSYLFILPSAMLLLLAVYLFGRIKVRPTESREYEKVVYEVTAPLAPTVMPTELPDDYDSYQDYNDIIYSQEPHDSKDDQDGQLADDGATTDQQKNDP